MSYPQAFAAAYSPTARGTVLAGSLTAAGSLAAGRHALDAGSLSSRPLSRLQVQYLTAVHELYAEDRLDAARQPRCCR
jgi:hypothetical protein